jgi:hypothetical protein
MFSIPKCVCDRQRSDRSSFCAQNGLTERGVGPPGLIEEREFRFSPTAFRTYR